MPKDNNEQARHNAIQRSYYEDRPRADNHRMLVQQSPYVMNHVDQLIAFAGLKPGDRVLDVGCGMGKFTIPLSQRGIDVDGFDLSPKLLEELRTQAGSDSAIKTFCGDLLEDNPELNGKYDQITGFFMLHHLFDLQQAMNHMAPLLKPGGQATFLEPNPLCALFYIQITLAPTMSWKAEKGILKLTQKNTTKCMEKAGFTDVAFKRYGILPPFMRNTGFGAKFEPMYDKVALLRPFSAFQMVKARLGPNGATKG